MENEFVTFKFQNEDRLKYDETYMKMEGRPAIVQNLHSTCPEYANCRVTFEDGRTELWHYPTELIKKQIEENEIPVDLDAILLQIKNLTP
jgi:hypothetical protein